MKKKVLIVFFLIIINVFIIHISISSFISLDTNRDSYIKIGQAKVNEITSFLYATTGPTFTYRVDIPFPLSQSYDYSLTLKGHPYNAWSYTKAEELVNILINKNVDSNFAKNYDTNYFKNNYISFDSNRNTGFVNNQGFHLFAVISNNAHLVDNPKKIKLSSDKLNFEAFVRLKGETTGRTWDTYYKGNIDFNHNKYYVTRAYKYNKSKKTYEQIKRGNWYFYNDADLIITDLGITGDIEIAENRWNIIGGRAGHKLLYQMYSSHNGKRDYKAKVLKTNYDVRFTPSWDTSKQIRSLLYLGE